MVTREPEWDDVSRAWAAALLEYESRLCGGCGGDLAETTDPDNEFAYKAQMPVRCHRCHAMYDANDVIHDPKNHYAQPRALMVPVEFRPPPKQPDDGG